jgi:hypothetical protein
VTSSNAAARDAAGPDPVVEQIAIEQEHVDVVLAELEKATTRAEVVRAEGLSRAQFGRLVEIGDAEGAGLFERDALVYHAAKRRSTLDQQYEGLVFGRLDLDHSGRAGEEGPDSDDREVRYIGRLGVRDDDYEPLVIDWRAPAAAAFYRATPVEPMDVIRRRVLRSRGATVVGVEDDLMVPEPPDDLVIVGDGALMAALTRSRGERMRDIVATIQADQDEAIRAPARGITEITGGPGTGKTVVALHRAAYLLYSSGVGSSPAASSSWVRRVRTPPTSSGSCRPSARRASRSGRSATSSTRCTPSALTRPRPPGSRAPPGSARCLPPPHGGGSRTRRRSSAPWSPDTPSASTPARSTGCGPKCCGSTNATPPPRQRRRPSVRPLGPPWRSAATAMPRRSSSTSGTTTSRSTPS